MEAELLAYRANPTNARFARLYRTARPWLKSSGVSTIKKYRSLSISGALDDVVNEGALALSVSARRFAYFCADCGRVFVHGRDLSLHAVSDHRRRGAAGAVSLSTFARTSARLAMRRTARRLYRPEVPTERFEVTGEDDAEERVLIEVMIGRIRERLSASARASLEVLLRGAALDSSRVEDVREEVRGLIEVTEPRRRRMMPDYSPEPNWANLNIRTLRESAREVLGFKCSKRTMKSAYGEIYEHLLSGDRELLFTCFHCGSRIDDRMERCWACGLEFRDDVAEEAVVETELVERARKLGIETDGKNRDELLGAIEEVETRTRAARRNVDFMNFESKRLNEQITEAMPDGWTKKSLNQYMAYFDPGRTRRIAIFHRGLRIQFSVDDGFLDGFPDLVFLDSKERLAKHMGRVNYEYVGDTASYAHDLCIRVMKEYGPGK